MFDLTAHLTPDLAWRKAGGAGGVTPAFQADFTAISALPAGVSLSRATTGTYFDASGVLQTAAIDAPRFDHAWNGSAWVAAGLLIEEQRTNLVRYSRTFDTADWTYENVSPTANATTSPDGTVDAVKFTETATTAEHRVYLNVATTSSVPTVWKLYAKKAERSWVSMRKAGGSAAANFDINAGVVGTTGGATFISASITPVGNGWYRCIMIATSNAFGDFITINLGDADTGTGGSYSYTGDGTSGLYLWEAGVEVGASPTSDIPTTTAAVTRSADIAQLAGAALAVFQGAAYSVVMKITDTQPNFYTNYLYQDGASDSVRTDILRQNSTATNGVSSIDSISGNNDRVTTLGSGSVSGPLQIAYGTDAGGRSLAANGGTIATDAFTPSRSATAVFIGERQGGFYSNMHLAGIALYSSRLSDTGLQAKSVVGAAF